MAKKRHEEEHENHERWLVSYADFITLLFAFFVVMYSVSRVDNKKLAQAAAAIKWALHYSGTGGVAQLPIFDGPLSEGGPVVGMAPGSPTPVAVEAMEDIRKRIETKVSSFLLPKMGAGAVSIVYEERRLTVRMAAAEFFDAGQAVLRPQILPVLDVIAEEIVPLGRPIQVEGHTDDLPVGGTRYRDNWDLSAARAASVVSYLENAHRARPDALSAVGRASTRPVAEGTAPGARELNRRVEMVIDFDEPAAPRGRSRPSPAFEPATSGARR